MENNQNNQYKEKGALDAFLNLLSLVTLGWLSISVGGILFQIINKVFSGGAAYIGGSNFSQTALKFDVASALIITPIFLAVICLLHDKYKKDLLNHNSGVYRWLTYLMLFVSSLVIIGNLIAVVFNLLEGDYQARVFLKILVMLVIAGGIFGYYTFDLKRKDYSQRSPVSVAFFTAVIIVSLASIIGSFFVVDSPIKARKRGFDSQRVTDLNIISAKLSSYYLKNKKLPIDLKSADADLSDPESKATYEYQVIADNEYGLCATFALANDKEKDLVAPEGQEWYRHQAGRQCFDVKLKDGQEQLKLLDKPPTEILR